MVFNKKHAAHAFAGWLNSRLTASGVPERGRAPWLAKRYKVSIPAARKWIDGSGLPDMPQFIVLVHDFSPAVPSAGYDPISAAMAVLPAESRVAEPHRNDYVIGLTSDYIRIPLLEWDAGRGSGAMANDVPELVQHIDVARWWAESHLPKQTDRIKLIISKGDANAPVINDGDIVFVDTSRTQFDGEGFYVFNWNGVPVTKRLVPDLRGNGIRIESANPNQAAQLVMLEDIEGMNVLGRVVAWYTLRRN